MAVALAGRWIGDLRGTIIGALFGEFETVDTRNIFTLRCRFSGNVVVLRGDVTDAAIDVPITLSSEGDNPTMVALAFEQIDQQRLVGRWEIENADKGTFLLSPAHTGEADADQVSATDPIRVINKTESMPKRTIYRDDLKELVATMKALLPSPFDVVIKADVGRKEISAIAPDFWSTPGLPREISFITLSLNEPANPIPRTLSVTFGPVTSIFSASGSNEIWVAGAFQELKTVLQSESFSWRRWWENYALTINSLSILIALIVAPSLAIVPRAILLIASVVMAVLFKAFHERTTRTRVFLKSDYKETPWLDYPKIVTGLAGAAIIGSMGFLSRFLISDHFQNLLLWLQSQSGTP
ncbi:hypothetical protein HFO24_21250 [Rhizobium laguerreae]|uniref:hypothetical protein n=1 Tax=Rhizobium TaxID=379 RepID=UPI001C8FF005|nr:hypothetical protein [Rhizobium laguerreae]MBY3184172.1 hypothetical protein [Rhizobium laguerreae]WSH07384.1 hypothetical protein U8P72_21160 [Rhizobium johnstonii]